MMIQNEIGNKAEATIIGNELDSFQTKHCTIPKNGVRSVDVFYGGTRLASISLTDIGMVVCQPHELEELKIVLEDEV